MATLTKRVRKSIEVEIRTWKNLSFNWYQFHAFHSNSLVSPSQGRDKGSIWNFLISFQARVKQLAVLKNWSIVDLHWSCSIVSSLRFQPTQKILWKIVCYCRWLNEPIFVPTFDSHAWDEKSPEKHCSTGEREVNLCFPSVSKHNTRKTRGGPSQIIFNFHHRLHTSLILAALPFIPVEWSRGEMIFYLFSFSIFFFKNI